MTEKGDGISEIDSHINRKYEIRRRIGKGAYGIVWKAIDRKSGDVVAVKKIFDAFRNETDAQRTFREIVFLLEFSAHPNVIRLLNVLKADNNKDIYLVFHYMETDLHNVIKKGGVLEDIHRRYIMYQLFRATKYLHSGSVIHRDLKPSNILIDSDCRIKVADFGLARSVEPTDSIEPQGDPALTNYVATRWYRAPEILLNSKRYTLGVDMWSLGCILGEMLLGKPLFPGSSTLDQIERIVAVLHQPSIEDLRQIPPQYVTTLLSKTNSNHPTRLIREILADAPEDAIDLVEKLLIFNPEKRLTAEQALRHPFVARFHNSANEPFLDHPVIPCIRDDIQLSVDVYRNKLYELIAAKKARNFSDSSKSRRQSLNRSGTLKQLDNQNASQDRRPRSNSVGDGSSSLKKDKGSEYPKILPKSVLEGKSLLRHTINNKGNLNESINKSIKSRMISRHTDGSIDLNQSSKESGKSSNRSPSSGSNGKKSSPVVSSNSNYAEKKLDEPTGSLQAKPRSLDALNYSPPFCKSSTIAVSHVHSDVLGERRGSYPLRSQSLPVAQPQILCTSTSPTKVITTFAKQPTIRRVNGPQKFSPPRLVSQINSSLNAGSKLITTTPIKTKISSYVAQSSMPPVFATSYATISSSAYRELQQGVKT